MDDRRDDRHFAERPSRRTASGSPEGLVLRERDEARPRRERGSGGGGRAMDRSRSRSATRRGGDRDVRRQARVRSRSRRRAAAYEGDERVERRDRPPPEARQRARSRSPSSASSRSPPRPATSTAVATLPPTAAAKKRRSGFDQQEMLPENYAMQQLTAMLPKGQPMPEFNPRRIWDTLPNTVTHVNTEVETFLAHNQVEPHAAIRLRALPFEFQQIVLSRGSLFGGRDPTAVLLGRIRDACRGVTNPYQFFGRPGQSFSGAPAHGAFSGTTANLNPQTQPSTNDSATAPAPAAESSGWQAGADGSRGADSNHGAGGAQPASNEGNSRDWSSWNNDSHGNDNPSWGKSWDNSQSWEKDSRSNKFEYRSEKYQAEMDRQRETREKRENELENKREKVRKAAAEMNESRSSEVVVVPDAKTPSKEPPTPKTKKTSSGEAATQPAVEQENEKDRAKREEMQSSIAATIASLSTKVLGKDKARLAGLVKESGKKAKGGEDGSDEDMDIDEGTNSAEAGGNGAFSMPGSQTRLPAPASLNPFRSKPHAAPVSVSPPRDPPPMALDLPLLRMPPISEPVAQAEPSSSIPLLQVMPKADTHQQSHPGQNRAEELLVLADRPSLDANADIEAFSPDMDQQEPAKIPLGLRALMLKKGSAAAGSKHPTIGTMKPGEGSGSASNSTAALPMPGEAVMQAEQNQQLALADNPAPAAEVVALPPKAAAPQPAGPDEQKKRMETAAKKAHALATLIYYGLTDPNDETDLAKAVHAMATATGDQAMAVTMWQQVKGVEVEPTQPVAVPEEKPSASAADPVTDLQNLSEAQQNEIQQAAAAAQYSQLWLQQQFHSQLALFENQRLMATGDLPTVTADGELPRLGQKGKELQPPKVSRKTASQPMLPGDWTCPGCGDHQFARNRVCRFCGAAKPLHSKGI